MFNSQSLTTRRGFIAATSFGVVSLYGLWAWFGAAPLGWMGGTPNAGGADGHDAHGAAVPPMAAQPAGHGGHASESGTSPEEFRRLTEAFVEQNALPDGSVQPRRTAAAGSDADSHAGHRMPSGAEAAHTSAPAIGASPIDDPIDVYLMAFQWGFEPTVLRLDAGAPYRFRMMAVDASHGASIQMGRASRIIRLRRGALVEQELTFTRRGDYLVYCTIYCGLAHDRMLGRIIVA